MTSLLNGTGSLFGKHFNTLPGIAPGLIGDCRTVTRLRVAADLLRTLWPKIACGVVSAVAAGTLIYVGSGS
jgi:hypothetical protein